MLDSSWNHVRDFGPTFDQVRSVGGRIIGVVYDLIPIRHPAVCHESVLAAFEPWLRETIRQADDIVCISQSVAEDLVAYIAEIGAPPDAVAKVTWAHLGANLPRDATGQVRVKIRQGLGGAEPFCLMVGTIEPRKGHATVLDAFERLWARGSAGRLCIIGRPGWGIDALARRIRGHAELGRRLI
jgi:glycosyltransferase involved in cell wall biosynthesis